jgi:glutamyl-tRNA synthetase
MKHKVRIAPSPTGRLHIGTIRTAYHNWLIAKQNPESTFLVRIDDTDLERSQPELIQPIFDTLTELGLDWDYTFKQSERFDRYTQVAKQLVLKGIATEDDGCIRLNKNHNFGLGTCVWKDTITGLKVANDQIVDYAQNQVIMKSDGSPAYNFASTVDDYDERVTWIVRGVDHISNTYKQALIWRMLNVLNYENDDDTVDIPLFTHVGLVCHKTGKKLSKRDSDDIDLGDVSNEALLNYVLRLGWSPKEDNKSNNIIPQDKAIKLFIDGGNLKSNNAKIDLEKLAWYNKKYNHLLKLA